MTFLFDNQYYQQRQYKKTCATQDEANNIAIDLTLLLKPTEINARVVVENRNVYVGMLRAEAHERVTPEYLFGDYLQAEGFERSDAIQNINYVGRIEENELTLENNKG